MEGRWEGKMMVLKADIRENVVYNNLYYFVLNNYRNVSQLHMLTPCHVT